MRFNPSTLAYARAHAAFGLLLVNYLCLNKPPHTAPHSLRKRGTKKAKTFLKTFVKKLDKSKRKSYNKHNENEGRLPN